MKKLIVLLIVLVAMPAMAVPTLTSLTAADVATFTILVPDTTATYLGLLGVSTGPAYADGVTPLTGDVGFNLANVSISGFVALGTTVDMTGAATFHLIVHNDNNQDWGYALYAFDGTTTAQTAFTSVAAGSSTSLSLSLAALTASGTDTIALLIKNETDGPQPDKMHTSVTVPVPGAFLLGGIGVSFVGWLKRRRSL